MDFITFLVILLIHQFNCLTVRGEKCETVMGSGGLLGAKRVSRSGIPFCAFLGVPFAAVPVGKLRFLPPESPRAWEGLRNFTQESDECVQIAESGSEDCLYLNVFTRNTDLRISNTVMVYIHGGGFRIGSSSASILGPEYLMDRDIVLVTLQYRLGPFGFLSTEDNVIPGNMGLKDQVRALQWVHENIKYFGGDPARVTLFGNSAGGASVHLHMLSSVSRGLFARGISQSGTARSGFALAVKGVNKNITHIISSKLNCSSIDSVEILHCLQNRTANEIIRAHYEIIQTRYSRIILRPVVEVDSEHAFLTSNLLTSETDKPWLVGVTANEGITFLPKLRLDSILHQVNSNFHVVGPEIMFFDDEGQNLTDKINRIYEFYFKNITSKNDQIKSLERLITDSWFVWPTENALTNYNGTFYYYLYDHLGEHSNVKFYGCPQGFGVAHTDELLALFSTNFYPPLNHRDTIISKLMVDFWVNFAMVGNPTPQPISKNPQEKCENNFTWERSNNIDRTYLHIQTNNLELKTGLFSSRMELWKELESNIWPHE